MPQLLERKIQFDVFTTSGPAIFLPTDAGMPKPLTVQPPGLRDNNLPSGIIYSGTVLLQNPSDSWTCTKEDGTVIVLDPEKDAQTMINFTAKAKELKDQGLADWTPIQTWWQQGECEEAWGGGSLKSATQTTSNAEQSTGTADTYNPYIQREPPPTFINSCLETLVILFGTLAALGVLGHLRHRR